MYIIIKRDRAEDFSEKLHKAKKAVCEILEEFEELKERSHHEELMDREYARPVRYRARHEDDDDYEYEHDMARGRGRGRSRY